MLRPHRALPLVLISLSLALAGFAGSAGAEDRPALVTEAESSGFRRTGRHEEVLRLVDAFVAAHPGRLRRIDFGVTPEGRTLVALAAPVPGGGPVVCFQGGIHAGEIDGKDAGFLALREILDGKAAPGALERVSLLFVPVLNADGHERFGAHNRPNQIGPEEMGWRTTAQNLNLNRDYAKAEAPEMQALLRLLGAWDPLLYVDLHVTDGADFQPDVAVIADDAEVRGALLGRVRALGHPHAVDFYPSFAKDDDPASGFARGPFPPRFSNGYWEARERFGVLVETHSWKDYATRVRATRDAIVAVVELARDRGADLLARARRRERGAAALAGRPVTLTASVGEASRPIDFPGYAYARELSPISGSVRIRYDRARPEVWRVPLREELAPDLVIRAPGAGYVVEAAHARLVASKLALHGVTFSALAEPRRGLAVEVFRATEAKLAAASFEGRTACAPAGTWTAERRDLSPGALFVPIAQPRARLAMHLLEPLAPDSLVAWGFFNACFERKEYLEPYVAEALAAEMLARDPALREEFQRKVEGDEAFRKDPAARLDFFYRRHSSWDERLHLVPIYRVERAP